MTALQTIRNWGWVLIAILGLALLGFIGTDLLKSLDIRRAESNSKIGKIYGEKINYQEFNAEVDQFSDFMKLTRGLDNLTEEQHTAFRDEVWQMIVDDKIMEHECGKLGITVTDDEMRNIISLGQNPLLSQTIFRTQQGNFDVNQLKEFLNVYDELMSDPNAPSEQKEQLQQMHNSWMFIEKYIRRTALREKYMALLNSLMVSNPVSAQASFDARTNESDIYMAALPFSSIKDDDIKVEDSELKAKYEELKGMEQFYNDEETRDIKYIDVHVTASDTDKENLLKEMEGYAQALAEGAEPARTVREAESQIPYRAMPVSADNLPKDIAKGLDSMSVGSQVGPFTTLSDNTMNIVRLIGKVNLPDSIEVRQIFVNKGSDMAAIEKTADSIITVLAAGVSIDSIAKKFDQTAEKTWIKLSQLEKENNEINRKFVTTVSTAAVGSNNKIVLDGQGVLVTHITDRRNIIPKYDVAVIKRSIDFSPETYNKAFNDISSFLAGNNKAEELEANAAQAGYAVQTLNGVKSTEHYIAGVHDTRETLRWIFNDAEVGDVSPLYPCGNNDHLLVVTLNAVHKKGYQSWDDEDIRAFLTAEVIKDKKAAILAEKMNGAKSVDDVAKIEGAVTDTIRHITFAGNAFVSKIGAVEPTLSGSASKAKVGEFKSGLKGNTAVYAYQVIDQKKTTDAQFDQKEEKQRLVQMASRSLGQWQKEIRQKANISDKRYIFF